MPEVDKRKVLLQRIQMLDDEQLEELAGDLVDYADRRGTEGLRNFIVDPQMRVILESFDKQQLKNAVRKSAVKTTVTAGTSALLSGLLAGPDTAAAAAAGTASPALSAYFSSARKAEKVKRLVEVLKRLRTNPQVPSEQG